MAAHAQDLVKDRLQQDIGESPKVEIIADWQNWGKTVGPLSLFVVKPKTVEEVSQAIRAAAKQDLKVRACGDSHSWSSLFPDEGNMLMYMKDLLLPDGTRIQLNTPDADGNVTVTVSAGTRLQELVAFFLENGVCFESNVVFTDATLAGVVCVGCHGVGWDQTSVSEWITAVTLVDSSGEVRTFKKGDPDVDNDTMAALQVNMGLLGIMVSVTMRVHPMINVVTNNSFLTVQETFFDPQKLRELVISNWSVEVFWFPFNGMRLISLQHGSVLKTVAEGRVNTANWNPMVDRVWVRAINPVKEGQPHLPPVDSSYYELKSSNDYTAEKGLQLLLKFEGFLEKVGFPKKFLRSAHRHLDPLDDWLSMKTVIAQYGQDVGLTQQIPYAIHYRNHIELVPVYDMEFAFDCPDSLEGFTTICNAISHVIEVVQKKAKEGRFPLSTTMEMRWIRHSDALLCPAIVGNPKYGGSGHTCCLEILSWEDNPEWALPFFQEISHYWRTDPKLNVKVLPHWAKMFPEQMKNLIPFIREGYGDNFRKFKEIRDKLAVDPKNMFTNAVLCELFEL